MWDMHVYKWMIKRGRHRKKRIIKVLSPKLFNNRELGYIPCYEPKNIIGRRLETILYNLTELPLHFYIKIKFKIVDVDGDTAYTEFDGLEYFREYIRSLFQRGTSYIDIYRDLMVEDMGYRIFIDIFTPKRINTSRKRAVRSLIHRYIDSLDYDSHDKFLTDLIYGVIDNEVVKLSRKIYPIRWGGVTKVKKLHK